MLHSLEELCITQVAVVNSFARVVNFPRWGKRVYIYIYIYTYRVRRNLCRFYPTGSSDYPEDPVRWITELSEASKTWEREKNLKMILGVKKMSTADFRRIKSVHWYFCGVIQYIVQMKKKQEILFSFWQGRKLQKHMKVFLTKGRKKERKAKISILTSKRQQDKTIAELELGSRRG